MNSIQASNLSKTYLIENRPFAALEGFTASFSLDKISVILGRSGAGKTTLIRLIAGLEAPTAGHIEGAEGLNLKMIFQESRLMPWLTVQDNVRFWAKGNTSPLDLLQKMGLDHFKTLFPAQISGGMAQKTALARALFAQPKLIIMDEPFASLDYFSRRELQRLVLSIQAREKLGIIFITHNVDEAALLGDELFILEGGHLKKQITNNLPQNLRENTPEADTLKKQILSLVET